MLQSMRCDRGFLIIPSRLSTATIYSIEITATPFAVFGPFYDNISIFIAANANIFAIRRCTLFFLIFLGSYEPFGDNTINIQYFVAIKGNSQSFEHWFLRYNFYFWQQFYFHDAYSEFWVCFVLFSIFFLLVTVFKHKTSVRNWNNFVENDDLQNRISCPVAMN